MPTKRTDPVYAHATARVEGDFGHVVIHAYELLGAGGATLKISCQAGGSRFGSTAGKSYAWDFGVECNTGVMKAPALHKGFYLVRRVTNHMDKVAKEHGQPETFAEYALRALAGAGICRVIVSPHVNAGHAHPDSLPNFHPVKQQDYLRAAIASLEGDVLARVG